MATASVTNTFAPLTLIEAAEANQNFQDLVTFLNTQVSHLDASSAYTAIPSGPASDPIGDNQFTRKAYVDKLGIVAQQVLTINNGPHGADIDSDMVLNNVPVVQDYVYAIHVHFPWTLTAGGSFAEWNVNLKVNGVVVDHIHKATMYVTQNAFGTLDGTVYWTAPATQATDDFVVALDEFSGSFSLTLNGTATARRTLTIVSLGKL